MASNHIEEINMWQRYTTLGDLISLNDTSSDPQPLGHQSTPLMYTEPPLYPQDNQAPLYPQDNQDIQPQNNQDTQPQDLQYIRSQEFNFTIPPPRYPEPFNHMGTLQQQTKPGNHFEMDPYALPVPNPLNENFQQVVEDAGYAMPATWPPIELELQPADYYNDNVRPPIFPAPPPQPDMKEDLMREFFAELGQEPLPTIFSPAQMLADIPLLPSPPPPPQQPFMPPYAPAGPSTVNPAYQQPMPDFMPAPVPAQELAPPEQPQPEAQQPPAVTTTRRLPTRAAVRKEKPVQTCEEPGCEYKSINKEEFRRHVESVHQGIRRHHCDICNSNFNDASGLSKHKSSLKHKDQCRKSGVAFTDVVFECPECRKHGKEARNPRSDQLKRHLLENCEYTGRAFPEGFHAGYGGMDRAKISFEVPARQVTPA